MFECDQQKLLVLFFFFLASLFSQNVENTDTLSMNCTEMLSPQSKRISFDDICKMHLGENIQYYHRAC